MLVDIRLFIESARILKMFFLPMSVFKEHEIKAQVNNMYSWIWVS